MKYTVNIANNLIHLYPGLDREGTMQSKSPLTANEIALRLGISPLLLVRAVVDGKIQPVDLLLDDDSNITLFGPVSGG